MVSDFGVRVKGQMAMERPVLAQDEERLMTIFKALSNSTRFKMLQYIAEHQYCITKDVVEFTELAQSTTSQHLKVLREAGLILGEVEGPATCYCLNPQGLRWFQAQVNRFVRQLASACCL